MKKDQIINELSIKEKISSDMFKENIKLFEKYIKSEVNKYDDKSGLYDTKMHYIDYKILLELYNNTHSSKNKLYILLLYMYSYYKLDGISFNSKDFPLKLFLNFIQSNNNIHCIILKLITNH
tara:strand:- start:760 stop:1125 length:366 start_codon:yes stop_codon:yes gene_type:complete